MRFYEKLNEYIVQLECMAKDIVNITGISAATLSRYRSGERVPNINSEVFDSLCKAIAQIAEQKNKSDITKESVQKSFLLCDDFISANKENIRQNLNTLISVLNINISKLCQYTNYDVSSVFRFRNGTRQPSNPEKFVSDVALYITNEMNNLEECTILEELLDCNIKDISDDSVRYNKIKEWISEKPNVKSSENNISNFLNKLDSFDLNEYIKIIHFNEMKVPTLPFQLPTAKMYYGLKEMMESELDFLKATVLSKSKNPVTFYSDMPMTEMAKDSEFPKKWMYGIALLLKKGLHLNNIHNLDRPFEEMMLGLESWIPIYMTGQISPYYLKNPQGSVFHHFLRVSGAAVLSGEAISGHHSDGRYYLSKTKEDITYYTKRAEDLLENAYPLMDIYRSDSASKLNAFILSDVNLRGNRRNIMSAPPLYTMEKGYLEKLLQRHSIPDNEKAKIIKYAEIQKNITEQILKTDIVTDEIPYISKKEFELHSMVLPLSGIFYEKDIKYTFEEYSEHLRQTEEYAKVHANYTAKFVNSNAFRNLQILIHEGQWVMISKGNSPAIHFIIHHPKLRYAIESFIPPIVEE